MKLNEIKDIHLSNKHTWIIFLLLAGIYIFLQYTIYVHTFWYSDNSNYFYVSKLVSEGKKPYFDFFFAHPPLQIFAYSFLHKLFGYHEMLFRSVPVLGTLLTSLFVFLLIKKHYGDVAAVFSIFIFLTSKTVLWTSTYAYGHYMMMPFLFAALYFLFDKRYFLAGAFFGLGTVTRLNILPAFFISAMFFLLCWKKSKIVVHIKGAVRMALGLSLVVVPTFGLLTLGTRNFIDYVFLFQATRIGHTFSEKFAMFSNLIKSDPIIFVLFLVFGAYAFKSKVKIFFALTFFQIFFIFNLSVAFPQYFNIIFPFMAVVVGVGMSNFLNGVSLDASKYFIFFTVLVIFGVMLFNSYEYQERVFVQGQPELKNMQIISDYIRENSNPDDLVHAGSGFASEIALRTGRRVALDDPIFHSEPYRENEKGISPIISELTKLVEHKRLKFVIRPNNPELYSIEEWQEYHNFVDEYCPTMAPIDLTGTLEKRVEVLEDGAVVAHFEGLDQQEFVVNRCY